MSAKSRRCAVVASSALAALFASSRADAHHCEDQSVVVGERRCSRFGSAWSAEEAFPFVLRLGLFGAYTRPGTRSFRAAPEDDGAPDGARRIAVDAKRFGDEAWFGGLTFSTSWLPIPWLSLGLVTRVGLGEQRIGAFSAQNVAFTSSGPHFLLDFLPSLGFRVPLGRVSLRPELGAGVRAIAFRMSGTDAKHGARPWQASSSEFYLEPRLGLDAWLSPHLTLSAAGAVGPFRGDATFALTIGYHGRSFDGHYRGF